MTRPACHAGDLPTGIVHDEVRCDHSTRPGGSQWKEAIDRRSSRLGCSAHSLGCIRAGATGGTFVDDDGTTFEGGIEAIAAAGITRGCNPPANTNFCPDDQVTRGQIAIFIVRAFNLPAATLDFFSDDTGKVYEDAANRLSSGRLDPGLCTEPLLRRRHRHSWGDGRVPVEGEELAQLDHRPFR